MSKESVQSPELAALGIRPAGKREWIPVEGLHFPHVDTKHNLSAGLQGVEFPYVPHTEVSLRRGKGVGTLANIVEASMQTSTKLFALASDNDTLYEHVIVPAMAKYLTEHQGQHVLIPSIGYPIIDWWKSGLAKGQQLVEGDYFSLMQKGKLPESIKAVYIDFPGTFFSTKYNPQLLKTWMIKNPDVLFVIDQANLGFHAQGQAGEMPYDFVKNPPAHENFILTNTTTKAFSVRVLAHAWSPQGFVERYGSETEIPLTKGLQTGQMKKAAQLFMSENLLQAQQLRTKIIQHREYLKNVLSATHGPSSVFNSDLTQGHALILDAKAFGFKDGDAFSQALAKGLARKDGEKAVSIAVKSTKYYTDVSRNPWVKDFVYLSIPFNEQVMKDLCFALGVESI